MAETKKNSKKQKYLNLYEEDLIWMSYRYCIGSHTISTVQHAGNIAINAYEKLNPCRRQFMAFDIRRCIADILNFGSFNFVIDNAMFHQEKRQQIRPLELFLDALKENNIKSRSDLAKVSDIKIHMSNDNNIIYDVIYYKEAQSKFLQPDIQSLIVWADLASCFDTLNHKMISCIDKETNEIVKYEAFESYVLTSHDTYEYKKVWRPVNEYIKNPFITKWIDEEFIESVDDMPENDKI